MTRMANRNRVFRERRQARAAEYRARLLARRSFAQARWRAAWEEQRDERRKAKGWRLLSPRTRRPAGFREAGRTEDGHVWYAPISLAIPGLTRKERDDFMEAIS